MKQVVQDIRHGQTELIEVPSPAARAGQLLIRTTRSLVSPGTERMLRDFGRGNLLQKVRQQPDRVRQVLDKVKIDGLLPTLESVRAKLDQPIPLGYSNVGYVLDNGGAGQFRVGDRVVSNGPHAEIVRVPMNLCAAVPQNVDDDTAAFAVLGSIALEGIRLAQPALGECVVVLGLGLVGLLATQLLRAQGVRVLGIDLDPARCALAERYGASAICLRGGADPVQVAMDYSRGRGVDAVVICAATDSNAPIVQAAQMSRVRGRIVLVGVVGLDVPRDEFFRKELSFQVSCSYGPGRYDSAYEEKGQDYPVGYVRWTAQRNFEAVLDMMSDERIDVRALIDRRAPIAEASRAYESLDAGSSALGILFDYTDSAAVPDSSLRQSTLSTGATRTSAGKRFGIIGAGNYATRVLIPAFLDAGGAPAVICGSGAVAESLAARKYRFARVTSNAVEMIEASDVDLVLVATRHDSHARYVVSALRAGRPVFVEKPLCLTIQELHEIEDAYAAATSPFLMVGFNRRFSPHVMKLRSALMKETVAPAIVITVNAGAISASHWSQNPAVGGGRIVGEACHFVDLARHLADAPIVESHALGLSSGSTLRDSATLSLRFANGAIASINYLANGHPRVPKERVEVYCGGRVWRIDNFRRLEGFGAPGAGGGPLAKQNKGQGAMAAQVLAALSSARASPISFMELFEVARTAIELDGALRQV